MVVDAACSIKNLFFLLFFEVKLLFVFMAKLLAIFIGQETDKELLSIEI
jgi:hypothetical protein